MAGLRWPARSPCPPRMATWLRPGRRRLRAAAHPAGTWRASVRSPPRSRRAGPCSRRSPCPSAGPPPRPGPARTRTSCSPSRAIRRGAGAVRDAGGVPGRRGAAGARRRDRAGLLPAACRRPRPTCSRSCGPSPSARACCGPGNRRRPRRRRRLAGAARRLGELSDRPVSASTARPPQQRRQKLLAEPGRRDRPARGGGRVPIRRRP